MKTILKISLVTLILSFTSLTLFSQSLSIYVEDLLSGEHSEFNSKQGEASYVLELKNDEYSTYFVLIEKIQNFDLGSSSTKLYYVRFQQELKDGTRKLMVTEEMYDDKLTIFINVDEGIVRKEYENNVLMVIEGNIKFTEKR